MAKKRTTPELNLQKELPQVLSTDFNLFYKPDVAPVDKSVDAFTKSLDAFVSGAGTETYSKDSTGEKIKKMESDAFKRAASRLGCGLHLWAQDQYFLDIQLAKDLNLDLKEVS